MFAKLQYRKKVLKTIFPYTKGVKKYFCLIGFCMGGNMLLDFMKPKFYKLFLDEVILDRRFSTMKWVVLGYLAVFAISVLFGYLKKYGEFTFIQTVLYQVKKRIFDGFLRMNFAEYENLDAGDMKMRLDDDTAVIKEYAQTQSIQYVISLVKMAGCCVFLFLTDWRLALFSLLAIPLTFVLDDMVSRQEKKLNQENRKNSQEMTTWLQTSIQGWREVRALDLERKQKRRFVHFLHKKANYFAKWINCWTARQLVIPRIKDEFFMRFGLYFTGGLLIAKGSLEISDLLVFVVYYEMMAGAMKQVSLADANLQANMPRSDRFMEQLEKTKENVTFQEKTVPCPKEFSGITIEQVTFAYPGSKEAVIKNFSLDILPGERIGIVGKSGIGKTTMLKLITGMIYPTEGQLFYSGVSTKEINLEQMHRQIGFVMQENILFHMSIRENLRYGKTEATESEMIKACKKACICEFIEGLPDGLDTIIGEKGLKLSGGQRQRLVLARLFLQDVDIYIFDEATSALDSYNENLIQETIKNIAKDKTIIVVAHRESSLRLCQRVVKLA